MLVVPWRLVPWRVEVYTAGAGGSLDSLLDYIDPQKRRGKLAQLVPVVGSWEGSGYKWQNPG